MIVRAVGGLCNRLGAILSLPRPLAVIWPLDTMVNYTHFTDVFLPLDGVTFVGHPLRHDREAFNPQPEALPGWEVAYRELRLIPGIQWWGSRAPETEYAAIHIRRTDADPDAKAMGLYTSDEDFDRFVGSLPSSMPVFVATDNSETQARWMARLGDRARVAGPVRDSSEAQAKGDFRRHTSLQHAAIDLLACAGAKHFQGSGGSSFSDTILRIRSLP